MSCFCFSPSTHTRAYWHMAWHAGTNTCMVQYIPSLPASLQWQYKTLGNHRGALQFLVVWTTGEEEKAGERKGGRGVSRVLCLSWLFKKQLARSTSSALVEILMCLGCWGSDKVKSTSGIWPAYTVWIKYSILCARLRQHVSTSPFLCPQ